MRAKTDVLIMVMVDWRVIGVHTAERLNRRALKLQLGGWRVEGVRISLHNLHNQDLGSRDQEHRHIQEGTKRNPTSWADAETSLFLSFFGSEGT